MPINDLQSYAQGSFADSENGFDTIRAARARRLQPGQAGQPSGGIAAATPAPITPTNIESPVPNNVPSSGPMSGAVKNYVQGSFDSSANGYAPSAAGINTLKDYASSPFAASGVVPPRPPVRPPTQLPYQLAQADPLHPPTLPNIKPNWSGPGEYASPMPPTAQINNTEDRFAGPPTNEAREATLARTPTLDQGADKLARDQATLSRDVGFNFTPEMQAKGDIASILNKDPRSALGIAARNASVDLAGQRGSRYGQSPYEQAIGGLVGGVNQRYAAQTGAENESARNQNTLANTSLQGQNELAKENSRSIAEFNKPQYQTDANGNLVRVTGTSAESVTGADKNPLAVQTKINNGLTGFQEKIYQASRQAGDDHEEAMKNAMDAGKNGTSAKPEQKFQEGQVYKDGSGNKAKYVGGKWVPVA